VVALVRRCLVVFPAVYPHAGFGFALDFHEFDYCPSGSVFCHKLFPMPNKSLEPTAVGAVSSAIAVHVAGRRWLSFHR
jgi:hypothetical protein